MKKNVHERSLMFINLHFYSNDSIISVVDELDHHCQEENRILVLDAG